MALRDQPYLPLYVQDFLTDEKLMECSASATGVYIKIMCILHKQEVYGTILLRQNDKQTDNQSLNFAKKLAKFLPYDLVEISSALNELLDTKVLSIDGDSLIQKRMIKDANLSEIRSQVGKKGGKTTQKFAKAKKKANNKANTESEYEDENEYSLIKKESVDFDFFWNTYDKKVGDKVKIKKQWNSLGFKIQNEILDHIEKYKIAQPTKRFRKDPQSYLNQKAWEDEIIDSNEGVPKNRPSNVDNKGFQSSLDAFERLKM